MAAPTISSLTPAFGPIAGGTSIAVVGTGFSLSPLTVSFAGIPAESVIVGSDTTMTVVTPAFPLASAVFMTVTNANGVIVNGPDNTFYFLNVTAVPDGAYSATNPFFDPSANYVVFGTWTFETPPDIPGGSITDIENIGAGQGIFAGLVGSVAELKSLVGGTGITTTSSSTTVTNAINTAANLTWTGNEAFNGGFNVTAVGTSTITSNGGLNLETTGPGNNVFVQSANSNIFLNAPSGTATVYGGTTQITSFVGSITLTSATTTNIVAAGIFNITSSSIEIHTALGSGGSASTNPAFAPANTNLQFLVWDSVNKTVLAYVGT